MFFEPIDFSRELREIDSALREKEILVKQLTARLDVPFGALPEAARMELVVATEVLMCYLKQLEELHRKLENLASELELRGDMLDMPEIYGPPEFFGIFTEKEEQP